MFRYENEIRNAFSKSGHGKHTVKTLCEDVTFRPNIDNRHVHMKNLITVWNCEAKRNHFGFRHAFGKDGCTYTHYHVVCSAFSEPLDATKKEKVYWIVDMRKVSIEENDTRDVLVVPQEYENILYDKLHKDLYDVLSINLLTKSGKKLEILKTEMESTFNKVLAQYHQDLDQYLSKQLIVPLHVLEKDVDDRFTYANRDVNLAIKSTNEMLMSMQRDFQTLCNSIKPQAEQLLKSYHEKYHSNN